MLIGRGDISNDIITLGICLQCLFTFALIGENLTARSWEATGELEVEFKFHRHTCKLSFL